VRRITRSQRQTSEELVALLATGSDPQSYREALDSPLQQHWKTAMQEEYGSLLEKTFTPAEKASTKSMAAGGCTRPGTNRTEQSDTRSDSSLKDTTSQLRTDGSSLDVITVFLNPEIDAAVHMELPDGIEWLSAQTASETPIEPTPRNSPSTAPRLWHQTVGCLLLSIGVHRPLADESLYISDTPGVLILLYVNDIVVLYTDAASEKAMSIRRP